MAIAAAAVAACALVGCGGGHGRRHTTGANAARLTGGHPCAGIKTFTCATLAVPLDHAGQASGALRLVVGYQTDRAAPRGVLLFLTGGPGQPGVRFIPRIASRLRAALTGYRLVMFDQRGTGAGALRCPALQAAAGSSDLIPAPPGAVADCARRIGPRRRFFTTPETVADIDELRSALGVARLTLDGVSYGTFVAERYALAYPSRVSRLVLDSVVPQQGADVFSLASLQAAARVLRSACRQQRCRSDPARDVATVTRRYKKGPAVLNALVTESIVYPSFRGIPALLHDAATGHQSRLEHFLKAIDRGEATSANMLSQGLHEATLCLDLAPPWNARATSAERAVMVKRLAAGLSPAALFPFDRATAVGNGIARGCVEWPPTDPPALPEGDPSRSLPRVPVLLFGGERDLSTPLQWARQEAARAPDGRLVAVPGAGHSVQLRARAPAVRRMLASFLRRSGAHR